jgi:hypothetical protein
MQIRQIQARYDELQDRVLLRFSTSEQAEFLFWLTRRFTRRLWVLLVKALERGDPVVRQQARPEAREAVLGMRHEGFVQQSDFSTPFEEKAYRRPLGQEPVVVARADYSPGARPGQFTVSLYPQSGRGIDLGLDAALLHSVCRLLAEAVAKSDWDLTLTLPGAQSPAVPEGSVPRTLN